MPRKASTKTAAAKAAKTEAPKRTTPMKPQVYLQYDANQVEIDAVVAAAKAAFKAEKGRVAIKSLDVYLKPQEGAAYYVINEDFTGKIDL
ncbi:MAG: DUF6465 family protein [Clostridiales bacterium]|nr:DUF6465 family protein [Clostridiales bacterium]